MDLKTAVIDGKITDIVSEQEFSNKYLLYKDSPSTAVEICKADGNNYVLPVRGKSDDRPGIYTDGSLYFVRFPNQEEDQTYKKENLSIVDFGSATDISDFLDKNKLVREMETDILTDIDSVFTPNISQSDSPEMRLFKQAIISKRIDINKYAQRFGDNFLNDKRILKGGSITMNKLVSMCRRLDIEAELTLRDTKSDVANPMNKEISIVLTGVEGDE